MRRALATAVTAAIVGTGGLARNADAAGPSGPVRGKAWIPEFDYSA